MDVIEACIERLKQGSLPPWKVEEELVSGFGIDPPENFRVAALCRRGFLEEITGEGFHSIELPEKPFKLRWNCPKDDLVWELDALDEYNTCSLCGGRLDPLDGYGPLVSNYVGGQEIYFSYAGRIKVKGDVVYRVELPNVEVGIASTREGLISPVGREALRIMGVRTAKEFAASLAAQVLAGEFNLALEISREKLYSS